MSADETPVEVVVIVPAKLLHRRSELGYTADPHLAMSDEPEAVDPRTVHEFALEARNRFGVLHAAELQRKAAKSLSQQIRLAEASAAKRGVDITSELRSLREQLCALQTRVESEPA